MDSEAIFLWERFHTGNMTSIDLLKTIYIQPNTGRIMKWSILKGSLTPTHRNLRMLARAAIFLSQ